MSQGRLIDMRSRCNPAVTGRIANRRFHGLLHFLCLVCLLPLLSVNASAQDSLPELPLPSETIVSEQPAPSAHLFLRELAKRQQEWQQSKGRYTLLANLFPAVLEQEGVVYNVEANGEWLLQNGLLVFQVLDDYRKEFDVLAWEQDRVWGVNTSGEIGSRSRLEMDEIAREMLAMLSEAEEQVYGQARSYLSLADLTRNNILPAEAFRPIYSSLGYQVARPADGVVLLVRAGKENNAQRNLWFGAVAFGGSCAWLQDSGGRMRRMAYMNSGTDGVDAMLRGTLGALVAAQQRYYGAYQHYAELKDLSGLYFERLDFSGQLPQTGSGIALDFELAEDKQAYDVVGMLSEKRLYTDQSGEISTYTPFEGGEDYLPLPGTEATTGFVPDEEDKDVQPDEGLDAALEKARIELITAVLNHMHHAQEAHLLRHGAYGSLQQLKDDGLIDLEEIEGGKAQKDGVELELRLDDDLEGYELEASAAEILRIMDETGKIREKQD